MTEPDIQYNIRRKVGFSAVRKMSVLTQEIEQQEKNDRDWVRRVAVVGGALLLLLGLLAMAEPAVIGDALRFVAGVVR